MTWSIFLESLPELLLAASATLQMMLLSFILAATLGMVLALLRISGGIGGKLALFYIELVRGTPALTLMFLIYFGLVSFGIVFGTFTGAVLALGLNGAAYLSEIYRAGIESVADGQREAAQMIGLRKAQIFRHVVFPQALPTVVPPMGNYMVSLLKDTSIASLIAAPELMLRSRDLASTYYLPMEYYLIAGAGYLIIAWPMMKAVQFLERRISRDRT